MRRGNRVQQEREHGGDEDLEFEARHRGTNLAHGRGDSREFRWDPKILPAETGQSEQHSDRGDPQAAESFRSDWNRCLSSDRLRVHELLASLCRCQSCRARGFQARGLQTRTDPAAPRHASDPKSTVKPAKRRRPHPRGLGNQLESVACELDGRSRVIASRFGAIGVPFDRTTTDPRRGCHRSDPSLPNENRGRPGFKSRMPD